MVRTATRLILGLGVWRAFTDYFRIGKFVTYADQTVDHIGRNIVLKQHGTSVWQYLDGQNTSEAMPAVDGRPWRSDLWGYLYYDVMVCWDEPFVEYYRRHHQRVGRYIAVGCLWSEHVRLIREGVMPSAVAEQLLARGGTPGQKLVSVFPTWYHVDGVTAPEDGLEFVRGIEKLVAELPDVFVVLKEKHRRWYFAGDPVWGGEEVLAIYQAYEELERHPRFWLPGHAADTSGIVAVSDLVISFPFTSVTVEALGAGVRGLYFDPRDKYRGGSYERVPGLVAHGYHELKARVEHLLYCTTDEEYRRYLDTHVKGYKDPFLDAMALKRFRSLLIGA
jgi:polysaccharide biosynthesis PFTS motif protein